MKNIIIKKLRPFSCWGRERLHLSTRHDPDTPLLLLPHFYERFYTCSPENKHCSKSSDMARITNLN